MTLFIITETSAGYALLKAKDKKLLQRDDLAEEFSTAEGTCGLMKLKKFQKFDSAHDALEQAAAIQDGKVTPMLQGLLDSIKDEKKASLAVADAKLGNAIAKIPSLSIKPVADDATNEVFRAIRQHLPSLIPDLLPEQVTSMSLGLSHSMSRHKLKFSPDKVDVMIIQAVKLLDDLDKEVNTYAMRVKEWYGWHFPEMAKIINDNTAYARVILAMGVRSNAADADLATVLPEEIETAVKAAAEISMGTDITEEDISLIRDLAEEVVELSEYKTTLSSYLSARMQAIAPNLTCLVGELVGARLIAHSGSLINLAKSPASTIQILGAEKALFRALKTKHDTPKYGLIYHASLVGQATGKNKGKIARMLATKTALGLRIDSLSPWGTEGEAEGPEPTDEEKAAVGNENRIKIERRLRALEGKPLGPRAGTAIGPAGQIGAPQPAKFELKEARKYNKDADGISANAPPAAGSHTNGGGLIEEVDEDDEDSSDEDVNDTVLTNGTSTSNGVSSGDKKKIQEKELAKAEKAARKAERAAKREAKAARQAAREAKAAKKEVNGEGKKRKHADDDDKSEKKKKKKKHAE